MVRLNVAVLMERREVAVTLKMTEGCTLGAWHASLNTDLTTDERYSVELTLAFQPLSNEL